jgi:hypothetical protein
MAGLVYRNDDGSVRVVVGDDSVDIPAADLLWVAELLAGYVAEDEAAADDEAERAELCSPGCRQGDHDADCAYYSARYGD